MKKTVLITGANSFIARHLVPILSKNYSIRLLTRSPKENHEYAWDVAAGTIDDKALDGVDYIVHLAGAKLNDGTPLTEERKKLIYSSRIGAADLLRTKLKERHQRLTGFVSASAIGYYGFSDKGIEIDEQGQKGFGFSADLCADWEKAADKFRTDDVADHVAKIRVSLVLGNDGGIFPLYKRMLTANPQIALQPDAAAYPWNHVEDMAGIFAFALEHHLDGVYNSVAPQPASAQDVFKAMANSMFSTDYAIQPYHGQHLVSHKVVNAGYRFQYPNIEGAVSNLLLQ